MIEFTNLMFKCGASVNDAGPDGLTPLMAAARAGNAELVEDVCRSLPAIVNLGDAHGQTALYHAATLKNQRTAIRMISTLFARGADVNIASKSQVTALQAARQRGLFVTATYLRGLGALGPFNESEKCKVVPPNLVLNDDSDDETQKLSESESDVDENMDRQKRMQIIE